MEDDGEIRYSGEVLSRSEVVARRREAETLEVLGRTMLGVALPRGVVVRDGKAGGEAEERYEEVGDYDAVLRWHCRL